MLWKRVPTVTQSIIVLFSLTTIINGTPSNAAFTNETRKHLFSRPFREESTELSAVVNGTSKTLNNGAKQSDFHSSTELMGGGGLQLFGVTNSLVNPGAVLSASIESGLETLTELVHSLGNATFSNMTGPSELPQFFGIAGSLANPEILPNVSQKLSSSPSSGLPVVQNGTIAQFFGIANIYVGDADKPCNPDCHLPHTHHDILTISITACGNLVSPGGCSVTSVAPGGTLFVLYPADSSSPRLFIPNFVVNFVTNYIERKKQKYAAKVSTATISIVARTPSTLITVTCPNIPPGISVATQSGSILPFGSRIETGHVQLNVSGSSSSLTNVAVACLWNSAI